MEEDRDGIERPIRDAHERGQLGRAAELTLRLYGDEILGFLVMRLRSRSDADEVFSMFVEDFWRALPRYEWRASMRGWAYTLARNAANRYCVTPHNRPGRNLTFTNNAPLSRIVQEVRTRTATHKRTEVKDKLQKVRERLSDDERTLLMLRVDRGLPWRELALVLEDGEVELSAEALEKASARVRKRYQAIKDKLKRLAKAEGLL